MFVAVADAGSFAEAARRAGISSGQASKLVQKLERDLGVQLLRRTTRALSLTEVGQAYHARMKVLLEEFDALDASARNVSGTPRGRLRLTAPLSFGKLRLMPLLIAFARAYPEIQLDIDLSDTMRSLIDDGYDVAIRIGKPADSSLIARKLCDARIMLVAAPAYLEQRCTPQHPGDLADHDCIVDTNFRDSLTWTFRAPDGSGHPVAVTPALRISNGEACVMAAEAGLGVVLVPSFVASDALEAGRLKRLLPTWEDETFGVYAIYPPARHLALKVRALVDFLIAAFGDAPP